MTHDALGILSMALLGAALGCGGREPKMNPGSTSGATTAGAGTASGGGSGAGSDYAGLSDASTGSPEASSGPSSSTGSSGVGSPVTTGLSCQLGGGCSMTQLCMGGIAGCTSNCQCLDGTWRAPCPMDLPKAGGACTPAGAECGYSNIANGCGAADCYCQGGAWSCGPTCVTEAGLSGDASGAAGDQ